MYIYVVLLILGIESPRIMRVRDLGRKPHFCENRVVQGILYVPRHLGKTAVSNGASNNQNRTRARTALGFQHMRTLCTSRT